METAQLVQAAANGDEAAWRALVDRFNGLLWSIARGYGLGVADAADVVQTAWLRLVERLDSLRDAERVGGWLATTTRRECFRTLRRAGRQVPTDDDVWVEREASMPPPDARILNAERDALLWRSLEQLSERCRLLLRVLMADPPPSYEDVGAALGMPIGSIGPTRGRCLEQLRRAVQHAGVHADAGDEG
jgi:RNA polymerase sigma factor (sigma-70 family)